MESNTYTVNGVNFELNHSGTKGMKWGRRLYQNKDGSLTALGRARYRKKQKAAQAKRKATIEAKKKAAAEAKAKAEKEAAEAKAKEADRQRIVKTGSASELLKIKDTLTKSEMDAAWARITWEQNMSTAAAKESAAAGKSKLDKVFDGLDNATSKATTLAKAWNMAANVYNAFSNNGISLPKIDTNIANGNRETRKQEKKKAKEDAAAESKNQQKEAEDKAKKDAKADYDKVKAEAYNEPKPTYSQDYSTSYRSSPKNSTSNGKSFVGDLLDKDGSVILEGSGENNSSVNQGRAYIAGLLEAPKEDD